MCLEVKANGKFQGANIVQNKCKHSRNQRFEVIMIFNIYIRSVNPQLKH